MAPPFTFTLLISNSRSWATARDCAANASLASIRSISATVRPAFSIAFLVAGTGPTPMIDGSTPPKAPDTQVAMGLTPSSFAFSSLITTTAAAPSLMPEAFPAVTIPSFLNAGRSLAMLSAVVPGRGPSSVSNTTVVFFCFTSTGTISSLKRPLSIAAQAFCWLAAANSSSCSLVSPHCSATFSAVMPIW